MSALWFCRYFVPFKKHGNTANFPAKMTVYEKEPSKNA